MARMHSRAKGKSGSTKPVKKVIPSWVTHKPKEVELLIVKYAKEGLTSSQIGIRLRDAYGIPDVKLITKKTINKILKEKEVQKEIPEDLIALIRKSIFIRKHLEENKHDQPAKRGLQLTDSKINRLVKYYKSSGRLPVDWRFDSSKARFYLD
ncbi:MAG: 30S ribosomal protein S15 [Nanoarchaeota archaeon]|nr:30S ribosomal protein S15 [Nanoarchaeota archaeon]MBU1270330.1 30S ribosomal protein S15 [Nanoarchaeota archaeon]MBU1604327.1 30S ribosomal protein S15 [Nanoarchaeota archaeon]MBU2443570.1 30S ribosomal protein S15 [Nanoarchaeota archaeon]